MENPECWSRRYINYSKVHKRRIDGKSTCTSLRAESQLNGGVHRLDDACKAESTALRGFEVGHVEVAPFHVRLVGHDVVSETKRAEMEGFAGVRLPRQARTSRHVRA